MENRIGAKVFTLWKVTGRDFGGTSSVVQLVVSICHTSTSDRPDFLLSRSARNQTSVTTSSSPDGSQSVSIASPPVLLETDAVLTTAGSTHPGAGWLLSEGGDGIQLKGRLILEMHVAHSPSCQSFKLRPPYVDKWSNNYSGPPSPDVSFNLLPFGTYFVNDCPRLPRQISVQHLKIVQL